MKWVSFITHKQREEDGEIDGPINVIVTKSIKAGSSYVVFRYAQQKQLIQTFYKSKATFLQKKSKNVSENTLRWSTKR